ncbi:MAG TPA: type II secretion system minor pseudopilin GspK [Ramlibacter sp.]|nr:type II secretion system minor pseudopilin GspK [Ramlibacter sp.]
MKRLRQRGAAILAAMITVTLVASFAAAAMWQQWRSVEVEAAERSRAQAAWILTGALDWARLILREDKGQADHLGEPWAIPLEEARLSTFLAADSGASSEPSLVDNVFLSGQIIDLQSMLNVGNLAAQPNDAHVESFRRLFELLGLPPSQLDTLVENFRFASDMKTENLSASQAPLAPQRMEQLAWLGLPPATVAALMPYVTILPSAATNVPVNLNTASAEVIYAVSANLSLADAQRVVAARNTTHFRNPADAGEVVGNKQAFPNALKANTTSNYFEVHGRLRIDTLVLHERSVLRRDGQSIQVLQRERSSENLTAQFLEAARR